MAPLPPIETVSRLRPAWVFADRFQFEAACERAVRILPIDNETAMVCVLGCQKMLISTRDLNVTAHMAFNGYWETWVTLAMIRHVKPGWKCADVGANCGYFTLLLGNLVGPAGHVWACEPHPKVGSLLKQSVALNGLAWAEVYAGAASDYTGTCTLKVPPGAASGGTIVPVPGMTPDFETCTVPVQPLDQICRGEKLDFVKIDAEAAEQSIWRGMKEIRAANPAITVLMEFNAIRFPDPRGFLDEIEADGFALQFVNDEGDIEPATTDRLLTENFGSEWMLWLTRNPI